MKSRLEKIEQVRVVYRGLTQAARSLGCSRAHLSYVLHGKRKPSAALLLRISELEQQAGGNPVAVANDATNWRERALLAERKLLQVREALDLILKGTAKLNEAVK